MDGCRWTDPALTLASPLEGSPSPPPGPLASTLAFSLKGLFSSFSWLLSCCISRWTLASHRQDSGCLEQGRAFISSPHSPATCARGALTLSHFSLLPYSGVTYCVTEKPCFLRTGKPTETESKISCRHRLGGGENGDEVKRNGTDFFLL